MSFTREQVITRLQQTVQVLETARIKQPKTRDDLRFNLALDFAASMVRMDIYILNEK